MIEPITLVFIALVTILIGAFSIIAGLGGGILTSSILIIFFNIPVKTVTSSVLISITVPAFIGSIAAFKRKEVDIKLAVLTELPVAIGAFLGAETSVFIPEIVIHLLFTILTMFLGWMMLFRGYRGKNEISDFWKWAGKIPPVVRMGAKDVEYNISLTVLTVLGLVIGFVSSLLGIGGGWIKTPLLIGGFGVPAVVATGTAMPMLVVTALVGGLTYLTNGLADLQLSGAVAVGLGLGAVFGNYLKPKLKGAHITMALGFILIATSILFIFRVFITS